MPIDRTKILPDFVIELLDKASSNAIEIMKEQYELNPDAYEALYS